MDKAALKQALAPFVELGQVEDKPFAIVRLDDAIPGIATGTFIVRIVAPWAGQPGTEDVYGILTDLLWRSTDENIRRAVFALNARATAAELISEAQAQAVWME